VVLAILHNVLMGFFVEHACISRGKKYHKATLCKVASGSFLWRGFLLRGAGCTCLFFCKYYFIRYETFEKNKVVQVCRMQKP